MELADWLAAGGFDPELAESTAEPATPSSWKSIDRGYLSDFGTAFGLGTGYLSDFGIAFGLGTGYIIDFGVAFAFAIASGCT